jgi:hypothetical protein
MGFDGAQAVSAVDTVMLPAGRAYSFAPGAFVNLDANDVIVAGGLPSGAHSDIFHPEIAWAALVASGVATAT